jgi:dTDP-4-amino-4,6-dideoxygalactose transaminase
MARVLASGRYILGEEVAAFEREFAGYLGVRHAVGVASGTDALALSLRASGVGPGDAVLTVSHTAVATVAAVGLCGARPVFVDIDPETYTMDPAGLEAAIRGFHGGRLKAIVPVHLYGHPADMETILSVARRNGLTVVEDCAQALGASLDGKAAGSFGDLAAFSFYPTKNLGGLGDGGMVATDDAVLAERVRSLREYGWRERYVSEVAGTNSRLDELQAAVLRVKLPHLDAENAARRRLAGVYDALLSGSWVEPSRSRAGVIHAYHQYVICAKGRDALREFLREKGISTLVHYPVPVHLQPAYLGGFLPAGGLPVTGAVVASILSLPMYPEMPRGDVEAVSHEINGFPAARSG